MSDPNRKSRFIEVAPDDVPQSAARGSITYGIVKEFLESNRWAVIFDTSDMTQTKSAVSSMIKSYARTHNVPVTAFVALGNLYIQRIDRDQDGNPIKDWQKALKDA